MINISTGYYSKAAASPLADWLSVDALRVAWAKVLGNGGCAGADGETLTTFARHCDSRLASLAWRIATDAYIPGPLRRIPVPKKTGGERLLHIPCVSDRVVQSAVASGLGDVLEPLFSDDSYAYRKGRSAKQAVERVAALRQAGYRWVVDGDIRAFFDSVPHAPLLAALDEHIADHRVEKLIAQWLAGFAEALETPARGLAQGSPLSPLLANFWLDGLDDTFAAESAVARAPVRIVRFADDFVLLTRSEKSAEAALATARDWLSRHGLELHAEKTRIVPFEQAFDFLGHLFVRSVLIEQQRSAEHDWRAAAKIAPQLPGPPPPALRAVSLLGPAAISTVDYLEDDTEEAAARALLLNVPPVPVPAASDEAALNDLFADADAGELSSGLAPLYVLEKGLVLSATGECFTVSNQQQELLRLPAPIVGRIEVGPDVAIMPSALRLAADNGLPLALLNGLGATQSQLMPPAASQADLHLAQMRAMADEEHALPYARMFVERRLRGQHALLKKLNRRRKLPAVEAACTAIKLMRDKAPRANSIDQARGLEGNGGQSYWPALGQCLMHGFRLNTRRLEADNPVVAVLNFTAHLLTRDMAAAVLRAGLHPGFGGLHRGGDRRDACAWDLVEAFRAPLSEGLAVYLFNNRILQADDFYEIAGDPRARLTAAASRRLVQEYETRLSSPILNPRTGRKTMWRMLMLAEARALAGALRRSEVFAPYALDF